MRMTHTSWGPWVLDTGNLTLVYGDDEYYVDLERISSSSEMLDWIFQVQTKLWADAACIAGLVQALRDVLNPQAFYCSSGANKKADGGKLAKEFASRRHPLSKNEKRQAEDRIEALKRLNTNTDQHRELRDLTYSMEMRRVRLPSMSTY